MEVTLSLMSGIDLAYVSVVRPNSRSWRHWAVSLAVLCAGGAAAQQQPPAKGSEPPARPTLSLSEAIELSWRHDPRVAQTEGQRRVAAASERSAFGAYLPSLSASATTSVGSGRTVVGTPIETGVSTRNGVSAGLSSSWEVFTGFRRGAVREQTRHASEAAGSTVVQTRADVALEVERTFYEGLRAVELEGVARARARRAEEGAEAARRKSTAGTGTRSDVLRAELELNTARQNLLEARTQRDVAAYALGRLVGAEGGVDPRPEGGPSDAVAEVDEERLTAELLVESPLVRQAEATHQAAQAGISVAGSSYYPQLQLGADYDWGSTQEPYFPGQTGWSVRLGLSYPIFDGFRRNEAAERARVQEHVAAANLADTRRSVRARAAQLLGQLRLARERIALTAESVAVAAEDLRVQQERYRMGVSTMLDLLTSQIGVVQAETDQVAARFDYRLARAELQALAGGRR